MTKVELGIANMAEPIEVEGNSEAGGYEEEQDFAADKGCSEAPILW